MHDRLADDSRRAVRLLTIVDVFTRECLELEVAHGFRSHDVAKVLNRIITHRGPPASYGTTTAPSYRYGVRSVGVLEPCPDRLLASGQANRQRFHRIVQRPCSARAAEREFVSGHRSSSTPNEGLASRLQRELPAVNVGQHNAKRVRRTNECDLRSSKNHNVRRPSWVTVSALASCAARIDT
jgi:hypothetical protein